MVKQIAHLRKLLLHGRKHEELAFFVVPVDLLRFGHKAQRSDPSQPAAGTGHFVQVILDTLGQRLSLHLCQGGGDIHHGPAKGSGGVEVVADGDKGDVMALKIVQQLGKIAHIAADAVQTIAAQHLKFAGTHVLDHLRVGRTVGAFAGKALVLVIDEIMRVVEAAVAVFAAHGDLIGDGFAGGRKLAFAWVDGDVHGVPPWLEDNNRAGKVRQRRTVSRSVRAIGANRYFRWPDTRRRPPRHRKDGRSDCGHPAEQASRPRR